jgi:excinuclease ABC subunit B
MRVRYLHSEIETLERLELLRDLREGAFDVLVGVNLLREGLDLPEVSLVCILDADKQGFLRSQSSLIQTMGRAARNANSMALLYADEITEEMRKAMDEVERRRRKQLAYNAEHGIVPKTIEKAIRRGIELELAAHRTAKRAAGIEEDDDDGYDREALIGEMQAEMMQAAERLEFEKAARLRDEIAKLKAAPAEATRSRGGKSGSNERQPTKAGMPGTRAGRGRKRR